MFGTRFVQTWRGADMDLVLAEWDRALVGVAQDRLAAAVDDCRMLDQPPDLPKFLALCRQRPSATDAPRVTYSGGTTDRDVAKANLKRIKAMLAEVANGPAAKDPLYWAKHPKSIAAVELMLRGAKRHNGLRDVVIGHMCDGGERLPSGSEETFLAALDADPTLMGRAA